MGGLGVGVVRSVIAVTGGRNFSDRERLNKVLREIDPSVLYVGDCPTGADLFAREWTSGKNIVRHIFYADWKEHGRAAGPIRNQKMIEALLRMADMPILVAFPGGRGTADCIRQARLKKIMILEVP